MTPSYKPYGLTQRQRRALAPPLLIKPPPECPRCHVPATGVVGGWWCGECSAPVTGRRA